MKRPFDLIVAACTLLALVPILGAIGCAVRLNMGSPMLFRQTRIGLNGRPFQMVKFRTMRSGPGTDAERITPLGRWLRDTSLDELPELLNILKGEMSLVGPRPLLPEYLPLYSAEQARRHVARPGITGLAQISGRNGLSWEDRFLLDVQYVERQSFLLDCLIIWRTIGAVLRRDGVTAADHASMPAFTGSATSE